MTVRTGILFLAAVVLALYGVSYCSGQNAARFAQERDAVQDSLAAERADRAQLAHLLAETTRRADSITAWAQEATAKARTHSNRATALAVRLDAVEATLSDTATMVPRAMYDAAREVAAEALAAVAAAREAHVADSLGAVVIHATLDSVTAQLARSTPRIEVVERFVTRAEPPCRWPTQSGPFPCLSRTQTAVVSIGLTLVAVHVGSK